MRWHDGLRLVLHLFAELPFQLLLINSLIAVHIFVFCAGDQMSVRRINGGVTVCPVAFRQNDGED